MLHSRSYKYFKVNIPGKYTYQGKVKGLFKILDDSWEKECM
jgi:hypothetical protein